MKNVDVVDVIVIGAGAAGLMCAGTAASRGRSVIVIEHTRKIGEKIRISGGGRCNFTNLHCTYANFLSQNPHFCKSALSRFTPEDFIAMVDEAGIRWHEKPYDENVSHPSARGQLFCDDSAQQIIDMLTKKCEQSGVKFQIATRTKTVTKNETGNFIVETDQGSFITHTLVVASGGLSIPKIGATNFGYELAKKFGLNIIKPRPGLVPLTFDSDILEQTGALSGLSVDAVVACGSGVFQEGLLFTHRGLSGPSILQISSYWHEGDDITIDLLPGTDLLAELKEARRQTPKKLLHNFLSEFLPQRLAAFLALNSGNDIRIADLSDQKMKEIQSLIKTWTIKPSGSEGYRTAEVTIGGIDTKEISSKTFEVREVPGLYFIGEVLDVTGHLGGHNFQWAWSSGWCAGHAV